MDHGTSLPHPQLPSLKNNILILLCKNSEVTLCEILYLKKALKQGVWHNSDIYNQGGLCSPGVRSRIVS